MSNDFASAMRRAMTSTRAGNVVDATRIIKDALAGRPEKFEVPSSPRPRRRLGEVVRTLRKGKAAIGQPGPGTAKAPPVPEGARFLTRSFSGESGTRGYRLYVPASAAEGLQGLILMLHGCKQNPEDFAAGTGMNAVAEANRLIVAYPAQTGAHNAASCWNWFNPGDQRRGAGEAAILAGLARELASEFAVPEGRIFAAGLSAGGAMAAVLGAAYPDLFAAIGVHSGLPAGAANDVVSAFAAMRGEGAQAVQPIRKNGSAAGPRTIIFHGTADRTVHPRNAERLAVAAKAQGHPGAPRTEHSPSGSGRAYRRTLVDAANGRAGIELWMIEGAGHAWAGGSKAGSYTDPSGPDASAEMVRFFLAPAYADRIEPAAT